MQPHRSLSTVVSRNSDVHHHLTVVSTTITLSPPSHLSMLSSACYVCSEDDPNESHLKVTVWNAWQKRSFLSSVIDSETEKKMKPYFLQYIEEAIEAAEVCFRPQPTSFYCSLEVNH
jgi:hypothetical protein